MLTLNLVNIGDGVFTLAIQVDETPLRTEDSGFGPEPVYRVRQVDILNNDGQRWHVRINVAGVSKFEEMVDPQTERHAVLSTPQQFETWEMGVGVTAAPL